MTVCIAAIYADSSVLAVSDRMITGGYGDTTFEPSVRKIRPITSSIAILTAGDQSTQSQIFSRAQKEINDGITKLPNKWFNVSEAARIYADCFINLRNEEIERSILSKYNLTFESYIAKQKGMSDIFIKMIDREITEFSLKFNNVDTLIIGVDDYGPHIFVVTGDRINCNDKVGFAAIGIGEMHASSHFMLSAYFRNASGAEALLTAHHAKKKSEVSPGVGKATDMYIVGPSPGIFSFIEPLSSNGKDIKKDMDDFYDEYVENIKKIDDETKKKIEDYLTSLSPQTTTEQKISSEKSE